MPCYFPMQANFSVREDGKKQIAFSNGRARQFVAGKLQICEDSLSLPCGKCIGCRLERSRQWAVRIMHESKLYNFNSFLTLTYSPENLPSDLSLHKDHVQKFIKRLRKRFEGLDFIAVEGELKKPIRVFYCGEYGDKLERPHYHVILFNFDFSDKVLWKSVRGVNYYVSDVLTELWSYGHCVVGDLTFDSAAYVARYCVKKVNGKLAEEHYKGKVPEFCGMSLKPGVGYLWLKKFGRSSVFPRDEVCVNGKLCKPPRYYDKVLEKVDLNAFQDMKNRRMEKCLKQKDDNSYRRLQDRLKCTESRIKQLVRTLEVSNG